MDGPVVVVDLMVCAKMRIDNSPSIWVVCCYSSL